jgi:molybdopterin-guanine dinucleotide biosynthesis protein A
MLPLDLGVKLAEQMTRGDFELVYASSKENDGKVWTQPVFCLMRADLLKSLQNFLAKGDLKIDRWFKELHSSTVVFENANAFSNVNTPEELKILEEASQ